MRHIVDYYIQRLIIVYFVLFTPYDLLFQLFVVSKKPQYCLDFCYHMDDIK